MHLAVTFVILENELIILPHIFPEEKKCVGSVSKKGHDLSHKMIT